ncbi:MAG: glyoxylase-like metal-dependent hydrolase (beta-lactamase superfamily II) [Bradymonadia bacterium]|jgi:glyoxylase-like metal-dependent hydrolase (beta-lactamase superfamily II)
MSLRRPPRQIADDTWLLRTTSNWGLTVNAYLVQSKGVIALIDSGFPQQLDDTIWALAELNLRPQDIDKIVYTHTHVDHMGGGVAMADDYDIEHVFWEGSEPALLNYHDFYEALPRWKDWLSEELTPGPTRDTILSIFGGSSSRDRLGSGELRNATLVPFGEAVTVGERTFECVDGRGHDPFHAAWLERSRGWLYSGDVVLRNPTPILPVLRDDLTAYRRTLDRWRGDLLPSVNLLVPGHGRATENFADALDTSRAHVRDLYVSVAERLRPGVVFDPTCLAGELLGPSPTSIRRAFIMFGAVTSQLVELEQLGLAERATETTWRAAEVIPPYDQCSFR